MRLIHKLLLGYAAVALLAGVAQLISIRAYRNIEREFTQVTVSAVPDLRALEAIKSSSLRIVASTTEFSLMHDASKSLAEGLRQETEDVEEAEQQLLRQGVEGLDANLAAYEKSVQHESQRKEERELAENLGKSGERLKEASANLVALKLRGASGAAILEAKKAFEEAEQSLLTEVGEALEEEYVELAGAEDNVRSTIRSSTINTYAADALALLLALGAGALISRSISRRVVALKQASAEIGRGNLDVRVEVTSDDEIGQLGQSFNRMAAGLSETNRALMSEISERRQAESALTESEGRFRQIAENIQEVFWMTSYEPEQAALYVSPAYEEIWGRKCASLYDGTENWADAIHPEDCARVPVDYEGKDEHEFEYRIVKPDGTIRWIQNRVFPVRDETGRIYRLAGVSDDITERKAALEQIKASLHEKEVLLKEIHHRVKNNFQVITSLLQLQSKHITDERARTIFHDSQNRIKSMALIHETLYQSNDLSRISAAEYAHKLIAHVQRSYRVNPEAVRISSDVDEVFLSIDKAVPCGLIINELLSNALKHAFPQGRKGEARVELRTVDGHCRLSVSDDGVGIPAGMEIEKTNSLGLKLVRTLTGQLNGELRVSNTVGAAFEIIFPA